MLATAALLLALLTCSATAVLALWLRLLLPQLLLRFLLLLTCRS
jgi:hypothetical protein